ALAARVCVALAREARALLVAHGYGWNRARKWRKRPMTDQARDPMRDGAFVAASREEQSPDLKKLVARARKGEHRAVGELRTLRADAPARFVRRGRGALGTRAVDTWAFALSTPGWRARRGTPLAGPQWTAIGIKARQLLNELCPPGQDSPVERL